MVMILSVIILLIDLNEKYSRITDNGYTVGYAIKEYFPYFLLWIVNTFSGILVFITVIFFTSQITNNTEVVAINSAGVSFNRFARPYFIVAIGIMLASLLVNHFILPWGNIKKNEFLYSIQSGGDSNEYNRDRTIAAKMSSTEYLFINSYSRKNKRGMGFHFQRFDSLNRLKYELIASDLSWSEIDTTYALYNYFERIVHEGKNDELNNGSQLKQKFAFTPDELLPEEYVAETMNSIELMNFIAREKQKGSGDINTYYVELYQRTSLPFSVLILTILALSISSEKRRGGIGLNLALGMLLAFVYIFSFEIMKRFAGSGEITPLFAVTFPNVFFAIITAWLYTRRNKM